MMGKSRRVRAFQGHHVEAPITIDQASTLQSALNRK
jgi:hypothetical protein